MSKVRAGRYKSAGRSDPAAGACGKKAVVILNEFSLVDIYSQRFNIYLLHQTNFHDPENPNAD